MFCLRGAALIAFCAVTYNPTIAAEPVGQAVQIRTAVSGARGPIAVKDPVYKDERISTSKSGLGQFVFQDGTKLAVGWGSSVVIDKFVYDDSRSVKKLTILAAKGTFRWISGKSGHSAYEIVTPAGTNAMGGGAVGGKEHHPQLGCGAAGRSGPEGDPGRRGRRNRLVANDLRQRERGSWR